MSQCIRFSELQRKLGLCKSKVYLLIKDGIIPKPIKLGRASVWLENEVDAALKTMSAETNKTTSVGNDVV